MKLARVQRIDSYDGEREAKWLCPECGHDWMQWGSDESGLCRVCGNDPRVRRNVKTPNEEG